MSATHGWWCNSVAYPAKHPGCSEPVLFFRYTVCVLSEALSRLVCGNGAAVAMDLYFVAMLGAGRLWVGHTFEVIE